MAKIVAAYIAHGRRRADRRAGVAEYPIDDNLRLQWQRIFCLFALIQKLSADDLPSRMILIADHRPPIIDGRLLNVQLNRLHVEFYLQDHMWRPDYPVEPGDYFIFDVLEKLQELTSEPDQIVIFGSRSLALQPLGYLFESVAQSNILFVEDSLGEMQEAHIRAIRERLFELRRNYGIELPADAVNAISRQFLGMTHTRLIEFMTNLKRIFTINLIRANRGDDYFSAVGELLAAILAATGFYCPPSFGLSGHAAAIPEDFAVARLTEVPLIVPGYGREPNIAKLFSKLLHDHCDNSNKLDLKTLKEFILNEPSTPSMPYRFRDWINGHII